MAAQLPPSFTARMQELLGESYEAFAATYSQKPYSGIRVNTLKVPAETLAAISPFRLEPIPWCAAGFYTEESARPGKHPYYHTGLYYIQEPSAMAPVELLDVQPGHRVLDLCAAPGGKSTQIAAKLAGEGLLVSNDLHPDRTKALAKNIELCGVRNAVVLNESPERIAAAFPAFFDRILIDAPCSGEGMFRKDEDMVRQWNEESPDRYAGMQRDILEAAAGALAPGGRLVYSTCTFSPEENEGSIAGFLARHPEFRAVPALGAEGWMPGFPPLPEAARLWPHLIKGEGHFLAVLVKDRDGAASAAPSELPAAGAGAAGGSGTGAGNDRGADDGRSLAVRPLRENRRSGGGGKGRGAEAGPRGAQLGSVRRAGSGAGEVAGAADAAGLFAAFAAGQLTAVPSGEFIRFGGHLYLSPLPAEALDGLKTVRPGWYLGEARKGRFIPGHPLATALKGEESRRSLSLDSGSPEAVSYLKGETLTVPPERLALADGAEPKGYVLVCIDGYSAGWGKWQDGVLKNEYPAGWRWT
ncbi:RsmB/NOP family class I SAM-dependent RNA methyltransferase [Paenibacillus glufosinatiresistens]|uniref:RsmB/NOP family class I SAM-dependent RNA methyltransferase n=1 Tax=Paenibacillus glufosinatiresistens TaxID=3070657 RepID=UPI00286E7E70|nr:RsmB/NOP family class I SAM-dependent RNA methyltransferase [Paenibacillus sp. YX.27]